MARGQAQIVPKNGSFALAWAINGEVQPNNGVQISLASVNAALDAVKVLAGGLVGTVMSASLNFRNSVDAGQALVMKEAGANSWTVIWRVNGFVDDSSTSGVTLAAAVDAVKTFKDGLTGTFQWANVLVQSQ